MTQAHKQIITAAAPETVTEPLIDLYRQWQDARADLDTKLRAFSLAEEAREAVEQVSPNSAEAVRAANALLDRTESAKDAADAREEALAEQIAATPPRTVVGVIIKAQLAEFLICENNPGHAPRELPERLAVNTMRDARRFLARLETEPAPVTPPSNALAEAEQAVTRRYDEIAAADAETANDIGPHDLCYTASDFIAETPPASLADVAVKLRRMCDATVGIIAGHNRGDLVSLLQILAFVEGLAGTPTYPTRRIVTIEEIDRENEMTELPAVTVGTPATTAEECEAALVSGFREMIAGSAVIPAVQDTEHAALVARIPDADSEIKETAIGLLRADEEFGDTPARDPKWNLLAEQSQAADRKINETRSRTLGGPRYKAARLLSVMANPDFEQPPQWQIDTLRSVIADLDHLAAVETASDSLIAMCAEWRRNHAELYAAYNMVGDTTSDGIFERVDSLADQITSTPPVTAAGFAAQIAVARQWHAASVGTLPTHPNAAGHFGDDKVVFEYRQQWWLHRAAGYAERFIASPMLAGFNDPVLSLCRQFSEADRECQEIAERGRAPDLVAFTPECLAQEAALAAAMDHRAAIARQMIDTPATTPAGAFSVLVCVEPLLLARHGSAERIFAEIDTALTMAAIASAKRIAQQELIAV